MGEGVTHWGLIRFTRHCTNCVRKIIGTSNDHSVQVTHPWLSTEGVVPLTGRKGTEGEA